jgi:hypothetical protein
MEVVWCVLSNPVVKLGLGLLGPALATWLYRIAFTNAYDSLSGPQGDISKAKKHAARARLWLLPTLVMWVVTLFFYLSAWVAVKGKGCDAVVTRRANAWIERFTLSGSVLVILLVVLLYHQVKFLLHNGNAKRLTGSSR